MRRLLPVLLLLALSSPASAAPQLAGTNVLTSNGPGAVEVDLPLPVMLDTTHEDNPDVAVAGTAPVSGFVLQRIPLDGEREEIPFAVVAARGSVAEVACEGRPCDPDDHLMIAPSRTLDGGLTEKILIEPGRYRWSAITDGSPVTVTLRFDELLGELNVTPTHSWGVKVRTTEGRPGGLGETTFGAADVLESRGLIFASMSVRAAGQGLIEDELCVVEGREAAEGERQSCEDAHAGSAGSWLQTEGEGWALTSAMDFMLADGDWSVIGTVTGTPPLVATHSAAVVGAWIPYHAVSPLPPAPSPAPAASPPPAAAADPKPAAAKPAPKPKPSKVSTRRAKAACVRKARRIRSTKKRRAALHRCSRRFS